LHGHVADRTLRAAAAAFGVLLLAIRRTAAVSDSRGRLRSEGESDGANAHQADHYRRCAHDEPK